MAVKKKRPPSPHVLLEREVTKQVLDFLRTRGWRPIRHQRTIMPGSFQTGEAGMADHENVFYLLGGVSVTLWTEFKRTKGGKLSEDQKDWQLEERRRGAVVWNVNEFNVFLPMYMEQFGWLHTTDWVLEQRDEIKRKAFGR